MPVTISQAAVEGGNESREGSSSSPVQRRFVLHLCRLSKKKKRAHRVTFLAFSSFPGSKLLLCLSGRCFLFQETQQRRPVSAAPAAERRAALCRHIVATSSEDVPLEVLCVRGHTRAQTRRSGVCESSAQLIKTESNTKAGLEVNGSGSHTSLTSGVRNLASLDTFFPLIEKLLALFNEMVACLSFMMPHQEPPGRFIISKHQANTPWERE